MIRILNKKYKIKPYRGQPFRVLIGVVLSHRTKDKVSWPANDRLFKLANTPQQMLKLNERRIAKTIYPTGFYNVKSKRIKQICKILIEKFNGKVPKTRQGLMELPGVGGKSADIVLSFGFGKDVIAVDTHVAVISRRWNLTKEKDPEKIRKDIHEKIPKSLWNISNQLMVEFGREFCTARYPKCKICPIQKLCPYEFKNI